MTYHEPPFFYESGPDPTIFLAGGITGCPDWQAEATKTLIEIDNGLITIFNPRRPNLPIDDPKAAREQIIWEHFHLRAANVILFWFAKEQVQPIALYELGAWSKTAKPIVVGTHPDYPRRQDIEIQTKLARPRIKVHNWLPATLADAILTLAEFLPNERPIRTH